MPRPAAPAPPVCQQRPQALRALAGDYGCRGVVRADGWGDAAAETAARTALVLRGGRGGDGSLPGHSATIAGMAVGAGGDEDEEWRGGTPANQAVAGSRSCGPSATGSLDCGSGDTGGCRAT